MKKYQWSILPQGIANSAILYQKFVVQAIQNVRDLFPQVYIVHYMGNSLLAHRDEFYLRHMNYYNRALAMQG